MFIQLRVDLDAKGLESRIAALNLGMKTTARKMMASVASAIRRDSRRNVRSQSRRTGELAKSIGYKAYDNFTALVYAKKFYASFLELGASVRPRNPEEKKYLVFKIGGEWKKVQSVVIHPEPFLKPVVEDYFGGGKAAEIMDKVLQKALDGAMGKS
jgi:phage gpG-like protein